MQRSSHIWLIFRRELRDQLRDRRTLFMILVLPILLYPILGYAITQLTAAFEQKPRTVVLVGAQFLPESPPLLDPTETGFNPQLFEIASDAERLQVRLSTDRERWSDPVTQLALLRSGEADAIVVIPPDIDEQLQQVRKAKIPIYYDRADERSQITNLRVRDILSRWQDRIVASRLERDEKPAEYTEPVDVASIDVASQFGQSAASGSVWARIIPFLLVMMSLTGAFYPAVDLCAGEKERGTMETLLISPASRGAIVVGKFLTVLFASIITALLNLASIGLTMAIVARYVGVGTGAATAASPDLAELQPPSWAAVGWMILLLIPLSMFFSAICVALAVMARSMKEGQYYMTPLYMVALPLIFLTLIPGVELSPFYSLVPITGVALLLKNLMLEQYEEARRYFLPVLITTVVYGVLALRWAVRQFQDEGVLFREAERFDPASYLRHLVRDRGPLPSSGMAIFCFALILGLSWYVTMLLGTGNPLVALVIGQLSFILLPPVALAWVLTSSPRRTLRLAWPSWKFLALGVGLALALNPLVYELRPWVEAYFPTPKAVEAALQQFMGQIPNLTTAVLVFALVPAICEEFAFRGFILSGLESSYRPRSAIVLSAFLFGFLHVLLSLSQQFFNATLLGLVLGLLAYKSRSLLPGIVFHFINNALAVLVGTAVATEAGRYALRWLYRDPEQALYHWHWLALGALFAVGLLWLLFAEPIAKARNTNRKLAEDTALSEAVS